MEDVFVIDSIFMQQKCLEEWHLAFDFGVISKAKEGSGGSSVFANLFLSMTNLFCVPL